MILYHKNGYNSKWIVSACRTGHQIISVILKDKAEADNLQNPNMKLPLALDIYNVTRGFDLLIM